MSDVRIVTNMAFPLASEPLERVLSKNDFLGKNAKLLLEKLGVPKNYLDLPKMPKAKKNIQKDNLPLPRSTHNSAMESINGPGNEGTGSCSYRNRMWL